MPRLVGPTLELGPYRESHQAASACSKRRGGDYLDQDLVACLENGTSIHPHSLSQTFERIVRQAGIRRIRLHDLRHTHATLALKAGVPVKVVSERLGHESPAFTLKQYAHVIPGMQAAAAAAVAELVQDQRRSRPRSRVARSRPSTITRTSRRRPQLRRRRSC